MTDPSHESQLPLSLECTFLRCGSPRVVNAKSFNYAVISLLQQLGVVFYECMPFPQSIHRSPTSELESDGGLIGSIVMSHTLLETDRAEQEIRKSFQGRFGGGVLRDSFRVGSLGFNWDASAFSECMQELALGRLAFTRMLIAHVEPRLVYVDDTWGTVVKERQLDEVGLRKLFWCTFFGPAYVEKYGIDFFKSAPVWKVEEFAGGMFLIVTEKYLDFVTEEPHECLQYMRQRFKGMRANRFKIDSNF